MLITDEIRAAFEAYLDEAIDYDLLGTPITRRSQGGWDLLSFAAGWDNALKAKSDPLDPQFILGFKAGTYAGRRRLELSPEDAPIPEIGSVKCSNCGHNQISFLIKQ
jgi:hypothetical protein